MSIQQQKPQCGVCPGRPEFEDMDEFSDHVQDEHDGYTKAMLNHLANPEEVYPE